MKRWSREGSLATCKLCPDSAFTSARAPRLADSYLIWLRLPDSQTLKPGDIDRASRVQWHWLVRVPGDVSMRKVQGWHPPTVTLGGPKESERPSNLASQEETTHG